MNGARDRLPGFARPVRALQSTDGEASGTRGPAALRFGLATPDVACLVFAMVEISHLKEALAAAERGPPAATSAEPA